MGDGRKGCGVGREVAGGWAGGRRGTGLVAGRGPGGRVPGRRRPRPSPPTPSKPTRSHTPWPQCEVLARLRHPHIVSLLGACLAPPSVCLVEELVAGGALADRLRGRGGRARRPLPYAQVGGFGLGGWVAGEGGCVGGLCPHTPAVKACARRAQIPPHTPPTPPPPPNNPSDLAQLLRVGADVADAMAYLHTGTGGPAVVHRDLKPSNVLLDRDDRAKARPRLGPGWGCGWWKAGGGGRAAATRATAHSRLACPKTQPQNPCSLKGMRLWHCPRHEPHPSVHRGRGRHAQCEWVGGGLGQAGKGQAPSPARPFPPPNSLQTPSVHGPRDVRGWPPDPGR